MEIKSTTNKIRLFGNKILDTEILIKSSLKHKILSIFDKRFISTRKSKQLDIHNITQILQTKDMSFLISNIENNLHYYL